jgi:hypothetical protein
MIPNWGMYPRGRGGGHEAIKKKINFYCQIQLKDIFSCIKTSLSLASVKIDDPNVKKLEWV